ncbi:MAG: hypothetical protein RLZZ511_1211 [Cyanobacteriota bacterium]|jgi:uncharacterized repeat protein (TIGR01451 family)
MRLIKLAFASAPGPAFSIPFRALGKTISRFSRYVLKPCRISFKHSAFTRLAIMRRKYHALLLLGLVTNALLAQSPAAFGKAILNTAAYTFDDVDGNPIAGITNQLRQELIDPLGRIRGCGGELLPDYAGFSVGIYEASGDDLPTGLTPLTRMGPGTDFPGVPPNVQNVNPFYLNNDEPKGAFNFFFDRGKGQVDVGRKFILIVNPPASNRRYSQRQIRIEITGRDDVAKTVSYVATALDGQGISLDGAENSFATTVPINDAATQGLGLSTLSLLDRPICVGPAQPIQIVKTADRAAAEPGDTVIYRLTVRNLNSVAANNIELNDLLPLGFTFIPRSLRAELGGNPVPVTATQAGNNVNLKVGANLAPETVVNIAYAVQLNPDAMRGSGENIASVSAQRSDTGAVLRDGPARAKLRIRPGLLSDCGTIIGRVFEDLNFDGEQQPGEKGIPNAVILLDDGTRITTDERGIYSLANVLSGSRTGTLDLTTVPGYTIAPNKVVKERNSQVRLVKLEPAGLVRMNFAVTPIASEGQ